MTDPSAKTPAITVSSQQFIVGSAVVVLWFMVLLILGFAPIPDKNRDAFNLFLGGVLGAGTTVLAFYFPSSVGARAKDEAITKLTDMAAASGPPQPVSVVNTAVDPVPTQDVRT